MLCYIEYSVSMWTMIRPNEVIPLNKYNDHNNQHIDIKIVNKIYRAIARAVSGHDIGQGWRTYGTQLSLLSLFSFRLPDQRVYVVKNMCICTHFCLLRFCLNCLCYQITLRVKYFYTNREQWEVFTGYLRSERRPGGDWEETWHWAKCF